MMFEVIRPAATGVYSNFLEDEGEDAPRGVPSSTLRPARRGQAGHDPTNVFHRNQNIRPAN